MRTGLLTALARPERIVRVLAQQGVRPRILLRSRDHGPVVAPARFTVATIASAGRGDCISTKPSKMGYDHVDLWLASPKCALHARRAGFAAPIGTLDHSVVLSPRLCARLRTLCTRALP